MTKYTDLFFDLDRTLWDFEKNSSETLRDTYEHFDLAKKLKGDFTDFEKTFKDFTARLWADLSYGDKNKEEMRISRFLATFSHLGLNDLALATRANGFYFEHCPHKPHLMQDAVDLLDYLHPKYRLHIITNGFEDSQARKIYASKIGRYFKVIIISGNTPFRKPQRGIFKLALNKARVKPEASVMIGDDWHKDVFGAKKAGMDQVYFDQGSNKYEAFAPTYRINQLMDLKEIF